MKKVNLKHVGLGIVFVLLVVGIPLIMDKYIIGNNVPSNIDNSDWVSFLGSYIGAVLGGIFTFIGIKVTLYNSVEKKKQEQVRGVKLPLSQRYRVRPEFCRIEQINTSQVKILVKCFFISLSQSKSFVILSKFQAMWFSTYSTDGYILC